MENVCQKHGCSDCCSPVKLRGYAVIELEKIGKPFVSTGEIYIPESRPDTVRLHTFECLNFDSENGRCLDYENRPEICRNTKCGAFFTPHEDEQRKIIDRYRNEKFMVLKFH